MRRSRLLAAGLALAVLAPAGCSRGEPGRGEARLEVDGQAVVERRSGGQEVVVHETDLRRGDRVELREGTGQMVLRDGVRMELRAGQGDAADTMLKMGDIPVLEAGDLLVTAPGRAELAAAGTTVAVEGGAVQVSRALGMGVAAYDGSVQVDSAGVLREVPALREMRVPALGRPPRRPRPLDYQASDPWDRRFLGAAIDLGRTLEAMANGYTQNLNRGEGRTPGFFRLVLPGLDQEPEFGAALIDPGRPPGEILIGAAITELGRRGAFTERWHSVFGFRDEGAEWGLVALDQGVDDTPLLGTIEQAVGSSPLVYAAPGGSGGAGGTGGSSPVTPVDPGPRSPGTTTTTTTPTTPPTSAPPPTSPPTTAPPPPDLGPVLGPVTDAVSGLVSGLLG